MYFPTKNPFLNLGLTSWVVYLIVYLVTRKMYLSYWISIAYTALYLTALLVLIPKTARE
jgi:hypothetical protein